MCILHIFDLTIWLWNSLLILIQITETIFLSSTIRSSMLRSLQVKIPFLLSFIADKSLTLIQWILPLFHFYDRISSQTVIIEIHADKSLLHLIVIQLLYALRYLILRDFLFSHTIIIIHTRVLSIHHNGFT